MALQLRAMLSAMIGAGALSGCGEKTVSSEPEARQKSGQQAQQKRTAAVGDTLKLSGKEQGLRCR
jgi:hypothetical protein